RAVGHILAPARLLAAVNQLAEHHVRDPVVRIEEEGLRIVDVVEPFHHPDDPVVIDSVTNPRQAVQVADHHPGQKARDPRVHDRLGCVRGLNKHPALPDTSTDLTCTSYSSNYCSWQ